MQNSARHKRHSALRRKKGGAEDEALENRLFAEFVGHGTVASLAGAIAGRLGGRVRDADLIAEAGLPPSRDKG